MFIITSKFAMKIFVVLLLGLTLQEAIAAYQTITLPPNLDLDAMLGNDRLMRNYIQCLMDEGSCPAVVKKVKGKSTIFLKINLILVIVMMAQNFFLNLKITINN